MIWKTSCIFMERKRFNFSYLTNQFEHQMLYSPLWFSIWRCILTRNIRRSLECVAKNHLLSSRTCFKRRTYQTHWEFAPRKTLTTVNYINFALLFAKPFSYPWTVLLRSFKFRLRNCDRMSNYDVIFDGVTNTWC